MSTSRAQHNAQRPALRLVSTKGMSREDWLKVRKQGIGATEGRDDHRIKTEIVRIGGLRHQHDGADAHMSNRIKYCANSSLQCFIEHGVPKHPGRSTRLALPRHIGVTRQSRKGCMIWPSNGPLRQIHAGTRNSDRKTQKAC